MPFLPVFLLTDILIYLLLLAVIAFSFYAARNENLRDKWRQVFRRPIAMAALVVLLAYVAIGLMDSVHLRKRLPGGTRYAPEILSLLDVVCGPLRTQVEKTYSAPFATRAYTKEMIEGARGRVSFAYPRLKYGGAHLIDPSEPSGDITARLIKAAGASLLIWLLLVNGLAFIWLRRRDEPLTGGLKRLLHGETIAPWRSILSAVGGVILLTAIAVSFSGHYHILGTDQVGQDVFFKSLKSIRTGLVIGTLTTLLMLPFALMFGITAGYFGGWVDDIIQYCYATLNSIPAVLLIAATILSLQVYIATHEEAFATLPERADLRLLFLCLILGLTSWTGLCRLLRGETLKLREVDYIQAAAAAGLGNVRIMARHIFPNVMHIVLIAVVLDFSGLVLAEAVLSYVGVGVDPSMNSWGNMINSARLEMAREPIVWWNLVAAFTFMFVLVLAANIFADAVRDALDPKLRY